MAEAASSNSFSFSLVTRRCKRPNDTSGASKSLKKLSMIDFESHSQTMRLKSGHCSLNAVSAYERHKSKMQTHQATRITPPTAVSKRQPQEKLRGRCRFRSPSFDIPIEVRWNCM